MKLFVPGRICLLGEHSDWAGGYRRMNASIEKGYAIICGTNQGVYAEVKPHPNALVMSSTLPDGQILGPYEIPMRADKLLEEAQTGGFWSYAAGVAYQVVSHYHVRGLEIHNYKTDLPIKKGLSSSAAFCVLTARAFNRLYDLKLTVRGEMELAYQGEITTPSRCGRMDQGCAFGSRPVLMEFDGDHLSTTEVNIDHELFFVIVDLHAQKNTLEILNRLNRCYPLPANQAEQAVQTLFGSTNKRIVHQAVSALQSGNAAILGKLMVEAQSEFDRYAAPICPEELTAPRLHELLNYPPLAPHIYGGKGVGSQGDGTAQLLARSHEDQQAAIQIIEQDLHMPCLKLTLQPGLKVRKAVIPAAGFGTRLFPASKAAKKEFFPIVGPDGIARPAILIIVEEALESGLDEVIIVVQEQDLADFQAFFTSQISPENYSKLPRHFQNYADRLLEMGRHVSFAIQKAQDGLGDAVYSAREKVGNEPFMLMLGDHLYRSLSDTSCTRQLLEAYRAHGTNMVGLKCTPESQIGNFGTVTGVWKEEGKLLNITEFAEKPTADYARNNLRITELPDDEYLTLFGLYILQPQVFNLLEDQINHSVRERGEFQLTSALDRLRREEGFMGLLMDGERFDIGVPDYYLQTLKTYRLS
mgnify:CR=1 FL=1